MTLRIAALTMTLCSVLLTGITAAAMSVVPGLFPTGEITYVATGEVPNSHIIHMDIDRGLHINVSGFSSTSTQNVLPSWSADGAQLAYLARFNRTASIGHHLIVTSLNRHGADHIIGDVGVASLPSWSPDGRLAYITANNTGNSLTLHIVDATGRVDSLSHQIAAARIPYGRVVWSPDGSQLLALTAIAPSPDVQLHLIDPLTGQLRPLSELIPRFGYMNWSPDGRSVSILNERQQVIAIDTANGNQQALTPDGLRVGASDWSADGTQLAFAATDGEDIEIYVMDVATGETRQLTHNTTFDYNPMWSPDGRRIAYISLDMARASRDMPTDIYVMDADGDNPRRLTTSPRPNHSPVWRP